MILVVVVIKCDKITNARIFKRGGTKDDWYNWCHGRRSATILKIN